MSVGYILYPISCPTYFYKATLQMLQCYLYHLKLDTWHFMRFPNGCTTDKHQLYGSFIAKLSSCIFKIDGEDFTLLRKAKTGEMMMEGISAPPSDSDVTKHVSSSEIMRYYRRTTRGTKEIPVVHLPVDQIFRWKGIFPLNFLLFSNKCSSSLFDYMNSLAEINSFSVEEKSKQNSDINETNLFFQIQCVP